MGHNINFGFMHTGPAPAISRLDINPYQWGTECLSGDVSAGPATSFPQSIGLVNLTQSMLVNDTDKLMPKSYIQP